MPDPLKMLFGVLSTYERTGWIHPSILHFFCDLPYLTGYAARVIPIHNFNPAASGRNKFSKQNKDSGADWLCMIDNDMHLPENFLDTLKDVPKDASIVVPVFYAWQQDKLASTLCWGLDDSESVKPGFQELTKCGTGAIFIRPEVFQALEYPYFTYVYDEDGGVQWSEDIPFSMRAREKGFKIYGNADVKVGHYRSVEIGSMWAWHKKNLDKQKQVAVHSTP